MRRKTESGLWDRRRLMRPRPARFLRSGYLVVAITTRGDCGWVTCFQDESRDRVDRSLRNDLGYWITFAGPFRFMDLTGIPAYGAVMHDLLPDLDCSKQVPRLMTKLVQSGARGVANAKGFCITLLDRLEDGRSDSSSLVTIFVRWRKNIPTMMGSLLEPPQTGWLRKARLASWLCDGNAEDRKCFG
jgi:hypothetical protein